MKTKKIKLAIILGNLARGGAETLVLNLIKNLSVNEFEIHLLTIKGAGPMLNEFQQTGIKLKIFNKTTKLGLKVIWDLAQYLKKEQIEIVHTHLFAADTWGRLAALLARTPIIISTEHSYGLNEGWFKKSIKKFLGHFNYAVIAPSEMIKKYQIKQEKLPANKIIVIKNGVIINDSFWLNNYPPSTPVVGFIGRLETEKGPDLALEIFSQLHQLDQKINFLMIGSGSLLPSLKKQAKNLDLEQSLTFIPAEPEPQKYFKNLSCLLIPSQHEGFGLMAAEAMSCGLPVVASNLGGLKELINHEQTGFLFEPHQAQRAVEQILTILKNPSLAETIRQKAYQKIKEQYTLPIMVENYKALYRKAYENIIG